MLGIFSRVAVGVCVKNLPFWLSLRTLLRRWDKVGKNVDRHPYNIRVAIIVDSVKLMHASEATKQEPNRWNQLPPRGCVAD